MKKTVAVTQWIEVEIDEKKFNGSFMKIFRKDFFQFHTHDDHIKHLAQMFARGVAHNDEFIEGYGKTSEMGISFTHVGIEEEIEK